MRYSLRPIGVVHSPVVDPKEMPGEGVPAAVEVYQAYTAGLESLEVNTHATIVAWLHLSSRDRLEARRHRPQNGPRGVFASRSPSRPNPIGVSVARVSAVEGSIIHLASLDFVDGTPVVDVKSPARGWDYAWSAAGFRDAAMATEPDPRRALGLLTVEAENFHGERCPGLALGVRLVYHAMKTWGVSARDRRLQAVVGAEGCVADAVQALSGATLGNGRLRFSAATAFHLLLEDRQLTFYLHDLAGRTAEEVLAADETALFSVSEGPATHGREMPAESAAPLEEEARVRALALLRESLVAGKLACPVAFKLARQLGVGIRQMGRLANEEGIKISNCQLGCFR